MFGLGSILSKYGFNADQQKSIVKLLYLAGCFESSRLIKDMNSSQNDFGFTEDELNEAGFIATHAIKRFLIHKDLSNFTPDVILNPTLQHDITPELLQKTHKWLNFVITRTFTKDTSWTSQYSFDINEILRDFIPTTPSFSKYFGTIILSDVPEATFLRLVRTSESLKNGIDTTHLFLIPIKQHEDIEDIQMVKREISEMDWKTLKEITESDVATAIYEKFRAKRTPTFSNVDYHTLTIQNSYQAALTYFLSLLKEKNPGGELNLLIFSELNYEISTKELIIPFNQFKYDQSNEELSNRLQYDVIPSKTEPGIELLKQISLIIKEPIFDVVKKLEVQQEVVQENSEERLETRANETRNLGATYSNLPKFSTFQIPSGTAPAHNPYLSPTFTG